MIDVYRGLNVYCGRFKDIEDWVVNYLYTPKEHKFWFWIENKKNPNFSNRDAATKTYEYRVGKMVYEISKRFRNNTAIWKGYHFQRLSEVNTT